MLTADDIWKDVQAIRAARPLVLNITNYVVANSNANALLALGASPAMTHHPEDLRELTAFASALVVNIGTPTDELLEGMFTAGAVAGERGIPIVLDPVACGVTSVRTTASADFLARCGPTAVRGNGSEVMALAGAGGVPKGADSTQSSEAALEAAVGLARASGAVVCVTGEVDILTDGERLARVRGGSELMPLVTGMGCTATALVGAFLAVNPDPLAGAVAAMAVMSACGGLAAERAQGPGTLQLHFYDALHGMTPGDLERLVQVEKG
ncbi:MAG: hydroxyethylthiazole kinase [Desulfovibrionaceae bacterium]